MESPFVVNQAPGAIATATRASRSAKVGLEFVFIVFDKCSHIDVHLISLEQREAPGNHVYGNVVAIDDDEVSMGAKCNGRPLRIVPTSLLQERRILFLG